MLCTTEAKRLRDEPNQSKRYVKGMYHTRDLVHKINLRATLLSFISPNERTGIHPKTTAFPDARLVCLYAFDGPSHLLTYAFRGRLYRVQIMAVVVASADRLAIDQLDHANSQGIFSNTLTRQNRFLGWVSQKILRRWHALPAFSD